MRKTLALLLLSTFFIACSPDSGESIEFTGNEVQVDMVPGTVAGNTTSGVLIIREKTDGSAQIEIRLDGVLNNAVHPVHLHFGSLDDDGDVATFLSELRENDGVGVSITDLGRLDDNTTLSYNQLLAFDGSIKVHFEASGPLENELLGAVNIGLNVDENEAFMNGTKSITMCNSDFKN